ncbi:MAG: hypothetical protein ACYCVY_13275 [Acidiferrobacteraceae bacterium]
MSAQRNQRDIIIVVGQTGHGKTTWIRQWLSGRRRVLAFDPTLTLLGQEHFIDGDELVEVFEDTDEFRQLPDFAYANPYPDYVPVLGACAFVAGNCVLAIDEAALAFPSPQAGVQQWARDIVLLGRHRNTSLIIGAQRMTSIPLTVRTQASRIISFKQIDPDDIAAAKKLIGAEAENLPLYPKFKCCDFAPGEKISAYSI